MMPSDDSTMRAGDPRFTALPPMRPVPEYPGMLRRLTQLLAGVSCTTRPDDDDWAVTSPDGRRIRIPPSPSRRPACTPGSALAMAELRVTMGGERPAFVLQEGTGRLWHRRVTDGRTTYHPIASVQQEFAIPAADRMAGIEEYVRRGVEQTPGARLVLGVKFADRGFARTYATAGLSDTTIVPPDDPRYDMAWALDLSHIPYSDDRVMRYRRMAATVVDGEAAVEMLARVVAAPVCQPYMHGMGVLSGPGGNGKGRTIRAITGLYGSLAGPFDLAALLGVSRASSTTNDQASIALLTGLLAYDDDAVDPGQGLVERLKKAAAGEELSVRLLQQNVASAPVTAFMIIATNRSSTLPSTPEWQRRIWTVPFRANTTRDDVLRWAEYVGDGSRPDDGIIDALMAGAVSYGLHRPDPQTVSHLTGGLSLYGQALLDALMTCAPLEADGLPRNPRVPVKDERLAQVGVSRSEREQQFNLLGVRSINARDTHGDKKNKQMICIVDQARFMPFAEAWRRQNARNREEAAAEERDAAELADRLHARLLDAQPLYPTDPDAQIRCLRSIGGLDGTIITPRPDQWTGGTGKGINAHWQTDATIRHPLHSTDLHVPDRYGFSAGAGLLIIDCDGGASGERHGVDALATIPGIRPGDLDTLALRSPHGVHLVYRLPARWAGRRVKAITHVNSAPIDLRPGGSSYVIGPGSHWTDETGTPWTYPGIVHLPPETPSGETGSPERRIPVLPDAIAAWIEKDARALEPPAGEQRPAPRSAVGTSPAMDGHVPIPPMSPGDTHDRLRDTAMRIAGIARRHHRPRAWLDEEMGRLRAAVPDGHDPRDVDTCITSAIQKAEL